MEENRAKQAPKLDGGMDGLEYGMNKARIEQYMHLRGKFSM